MAAAYLMKRGARLLGRNVRVGHGEVDLVVGFGRTRVAVEVKTRRAGDPLEAFTPEKARRVREAAAQLRPPAHRVDLVAVRLTEEAVEVRWHPRVGNGFP